MNRTKYFGALLIPILSLLFPLSSASPLDDDAARASLKGIEAIRLAVEELIPDVVKEGLTSNQIHTAAEQQLREEGIKVVADDKMPFLLVSPSIAKFGKNYYVYTVKVELYQVVVPSRFLPEKEGSSSVQNALFASTWGSPGGIGAAPNLQDVKPSIKAEIAKFIQAFKAANR